MKDEDTIQLYDNANRDWCFFLLASCYSLSNGTIVIFSLAKTYHISSSLDDRRRGPSYFFRA